MVLTVLVALGLGGAAVALGLRAIAMPRIAAAARIAEMQAYGFTGEAPPEVVGEKRLIESIATAVGKLASRVSSRFKEAEIRNQLMAAGLYTTAPMTFLGYRVLGAGLTFTTMLWLISAGDSSGPKVILFPVLAAAAGWVVPMTIVRRRAERRLEQVESDLPELIDLLVVTVEAGLALNRSLQVASERFHGPLRDELRLTLQEQRMGLSTSVALTNMLGRCETPSMRSFVRSIIQGENLGVSMGTIMRNLAVETRKRRKQHAEERAHKAPVKMLFPLVLLMFPSMFIVLLYPAVQKFSQAIGG
ncbi:MAG TPA: type II secretion system F family protein [Thermoleophilaceae bacterium]|nr:type II secretion system F family protein [Thermoleophilaceae bacterium]